MSDYAVGIDLGGTNLKAALVKREEGFQKRASIPTEADKGPEHIIEQMAEAIDRMIAATPGREIAGVGIGSPGPIDWDRTTVLNPPNLPGWQEVNLREALQARIGGGIEVIVENDANAAGLGAAFYGAGRPFDSFIMVTLGTGVGGAVIYQNNIFRGATGGAGEIGHVSIDYEGPRERYGIAGAVEAYIGQNFLSHHARYWLLPRTESRVHELAGEDLEDLTPEMLYEAAKEGDAPATEVLAWAGHKLGCVLSSAVNLLDIRKVVVGGGVSGAGDFILEPARKALARYAMPGLRDDLEIVQETQGNDVGLLGAAHLAFTATDLPAARPSDASTVGASPAR